MANDAHNAAHLSYIQTHSAKPIFAFLPTAYRYMPKQYVDRFFSHDELRLSSFAEFSRHENAFKGDREEGKTFVGINDKEGNSSFFAFNTRGRNAYILSTTVRTTGDMDNVFGDASIKIFDLLAFASEVANEIPGSLSAQLGWCRYVESKILISDQRGPTMDELKDDIDPDSYSINKIMQRSQTISGPKELFLKPLKHEVEAEFRFIWETNRPVDEPLIVNFQNSDRFCRLGKSRESKSAS